MKMFLHTTSKVRIISGALEWSGTPAEFQALEPDYPGLPVLTQAPAVTRYQTLEWKYLEDSNGAKYPDMFTALGYCDNIPAYLDAEPPAIYVHPELSKALLCASDPADAIHFALDMRSGPLPTDPLLPITATWPIMLRQKNGLSMDNILINFTNGHAEANYTYSPALPLGEWHVDEQDFDQVTLGDTVFAVKLAAPVRFTVYRNL